MRRDSDSGYTDWDTVWTTLLMFVVMSFVGSILWSVVKDSTGWFEKDNPVLCFADLRPDPDGTFTLGDRNGTFTLVRVCQTVDIDE